MWQTIQVNAYFNYQKKNHKDRTEKNVAYMFYHSADTFRSVSHWQKRAMLKKRRQNIVLCFLLISKIRFFIKIRNLNMNCIPWYTMVDLPEIMVYLPDNMLDLPDTLVDLPETMVDLPDIMVDLPDTVVDVHATLFFLLFFFFFLFSPNLFFYLCFHPDISKNIPKLVLFMLYQGVWGLQHTVKSAFQPLIFIHVIDTRCYETNDADCYAYCSNQLCCLWKSRENKKEITSLRLPNNHA